MPPRKRTLEPTNPNGGLQPDAKRLKKVADGKENADAIDWYHSMSSDELRQLCSSRGLAPREYHMNKLLLIEYDTTPSFIQPFLNEDVDYILYLAEADKKGNPMTEVDNRMNVIKPVYSLSEEIEQRRLEARKKLRRAGVKVRDLDEQRVNDKMSADREFEKTKQGQLPPDFVFDRTPGAMAELCRLRNVPTDGTRDQLKARLKQLDLEVRKHGKLYIDQQIDQARKSSCAGRRAIALRIQMEKTDIAATEGNPSDPAANKKRAQLCEDKVLEALGKDAALFAAQLQQEDRPVEAAVIGARMLHAILPQWLSRGGSGGYRNLRAAELRELARLRGFSDRGEAVQCRAWLGGSDIQLIRSFREDEASSPSSTKMV